MTEARNLSEVGKFRGVVRQLRVDDLPNIRPILETWLRDRNTGELLVNEVEEDL